MRVLCVQPLPPRQFPCPTPTPGVLSAGNRVREPAGPAGKEALPFVCLGGRPPEASPSPGLWEDKVRSKAAALNGGGGGVRT